MSTDSIAIANTQRGAIIGLDLEQWKMLSNGEKDISNSVTLEESEIVKRPGSMFAVNVNSVVADTDHHIVGGHGYNFKKTLVEWRKLSYVSENSVLKYRDFTGMYKPHGSSNSRVSPPFTFITYLDKPYRARTLFKSYLEHDLYKWKGMEKYHNMVDEILNDFVDYVLEESFPFNTVTLDLNQFSGCKYSMQDRRAYFGYFPDMLLIKHIIRYIEKMPLYAFVRTGKRGIYSPIVIGGAFSCPSSAICNLINLLTGNEISSMFHTAIGLAMVDLLSSWMQAASLLGAYKSSLIIQRLLRIQFDLTKKDTELFLQDRISRLQTLVSYMGNQVLAQFKSRIAESKEEN